MKILQQFKEKDLIFIDIECARIVDKLQRGTSLYDAWAYKMRYQNEIAEKAGQDVMSLEESFASKASLYAPFSKIVCIVAGSIADDKLKYRAYTGNEADILTSFNNDLLMKTTVNPDACFIGFNNIGFDQPFITKRMLVNNVPFTSLLDNTTEKPWTIRSVDLSQVWRGTSFYPDSLQAVAVAMGLPSPKQGIDGTEVSDYFYAGKINEIVKYCVGDTLCTANLFRKFLNKKLVTLAT